MATPAEPRGEHKCFLVQILGGEKPLTPHTPQIRGVAFSPRKVQGWAFKSTVKQVFLLTIHPRNLGGKFHPPNLGGVDYCQGTFRKVPVKHF